jgi:hypothetical protein
LTGIFVSNTKSFENKIFIFWCKIIKKKTLTSIAYDAAIVDTDHIEVPRKVVKGGPSLRTVCSCRLTFLGSLSNPTFFFFHIYIDILLLLYFLILMPN